MWLSWSLFKNILANVSERFINTSLEYYGSDPCQYFSSPELSYDAMLKMTKIELTFSRHWHVFICWERNERRYFLYG